MGRLIQSTNYKAQCTNNQGIPFGNLNNAECRNGGLNEK